MIYISDYNFILEWETSRFDRLYVCVYVCVCMCVSLIVAKWAK